MVVSEDITILPRSVINEYFKTNLFAAYQAVKNAYLSFYHNEAINPASSFLWYNNETKSRIICLPAFIKGKDLYPGMKWIASCPNNLDKALPRASGLIVLNDFETGYPIVIMEGALISCLRTALSALIALEHLLAPRTNINNLAIIGAGTIASNVLECAQALGWSIEHITIFDKELKYSNNFIERHNSRNASIARTVEETVKDADVVLLTTTETNPYIKEAAIFQQSATILNLSLRDLSPEIIISSYNIVDDLEHVLAANTSPHLAFLQTGNTGFITGNLGALMEGLIKTNNDKLKIFSPMGMGILDIALANLVFSACQDENNSLKIKNFFS